MVKWVVIGVVVTALCGVAYYIFDVIQDQTAQITLLTQEKISAQAKAQTWEQANVLLEDGLTRLETSVAQMNTRLTDLNTTFSRIQQERGERNAVFARHDLNNLLVAKPGLVETRINKATAAIFLEFEEVFQ